MPQSGDSLHIKLTICLEKQAIKDQKLTFFAEFLKKMQKNLTFFKNGAGYCSEPGGNRKKTA